jgi:acetyl-CoA carboxylase biotin carboxyl carrier protein
VKPEATIVAIWHDADQGHARLVSPTVGWFEPALGAGDVVRAGATLGWLDTLGVIREIVAPAQAHGVIRGGPGDNRARIAVDCDHLLFAVDPEAAIGHEAIAHTSAPTAATGLVFRAPTSGRFYVRPSPDKPPFVEAGTKLVAGRTVCLLEVMKTFHRVTYGGAGLPDAATVVAVLVADGADVNVGDPLLSLTPA